MKSCFADFELSNPGRPVDWRWQRALSLVATRKNYCRHRDDEATGMAVYYLRELRRREDGRASGRILRRFRDLHAAHVVYGSGNVLKGIIEARILARQSSAEIAAVLDVPLAVIEIYQQVFFHVRDRLRARLYILGEAIRAHRCATPEEGTCAALKRFGYFGGPHVLERAIPVLVGDLEGHDAADLPTAEPSATELTIRIAARLWTMPLRASRAPAFVDACRRLTSIPRLDEAVPGLAISSPFVHLVDTTCHRGLPNHDDEKRSFNDEMCEVA